MTEEKGILGISLIKGMRSTRDPAGIMNPSKLTDEDISASDAVAIIALPLALTATASAQDRSPR